MDWEQLKAKIEDIFDDYVESRATCPRCECEFEVNECIGYAEEQLLDAIDAWLLEEYSNEQNQSNDSNAKS